jgi:two-component system nitrate/nitrite response regulator NarL
MATRVLIVDDHASFRAAARAVLESGGYEVIGEAADGAGALAECARLAPDLVLLDVQLPDIDGFGVARELAGIGVPPEVVLVSNRSRSTYRRRLEGARVSGFLTKSELSPESIGALLA